MTKMMLERTFVRDALTWLSYAMLGWYAYLQAAVSPLAVFIRAEFELDYTAQALHLTAFALGMVAAGATASGLAARFGRRMLYWGGAMGMAAGSALLGLGQTVVVTIAAAAAMGWMGTYCLIMVQAVLSDRHGERRAVALSEANVLASLTAALVPAAAAIGEQTGVGWRLAILVGLVLGAPLLLGWRVALPQAPARPQQADGTQARARLPAAYWVYWLVIILSVSMEWCMIFWSASFMEVAHGLPVPEAATAVSVFFFAQFVGRFVGSRLALRVQAERLLLGAGLLAAVAFPVFWLAPTPWLGFAGLFACGLGTGNLFPLSLAAASGVGRANPDAASSRVSLGTGLAIFMVPQFLGTMADGVGIQTAYAVVLPLSVLVIGGTVMAGRLRRTERV